MSMFKMDWFQVSENETKNNQANTANADNKRTAKEKRLAHIRASIDELNRIRVEYGLEPITD